MTDRFIVPLKGEHYPARLLPLDLFDLQYAKNVLDAMCIEVLTPWWLGLIGDTTAADIARMEGEGGVPC